MRTMFWLVHESKGLLLTKEINDITENFSVLNVTGVGSPPTVVPIRVQVALIARRLFILKSNVL